MILTEVSRAVLKWHEDHARRYNVWWAGDPVLFDALRAALAEEESAATAPGKSAVERAEDVVDDFCSDPSWACYFLGQSQSYQDNPKHYESWDEPLKRVLIQTISGAIESAERAGYERGCRETCAAGMRALTETKR